MYIAKRRNPSSGSAKRSREILVVGSKIKEFIRNKGLHSSGDLIESLSRHIEEKLSRAVERAKANGRKTIRPEDL